MNIFGEKFPQHNSFLPSNRIEYKNCLGLDFPDRKYYALDLNDKSGNGNTLTNVGGDEITTNLPFVASTEAVGLVAANSDRLYASDSVSLSITGDYWGTHTDTFDIDREGF